GGGGVGNASNETAARASPWAVGSSCGAAAPGSLHGGRVVSLKQIRLSAQAKEQLIRLKTRTGVGQWNILCRWAFCLSLRQAAPPTPVEVPADSNVEMSWQVFGGECQELYFALLKERCEADGLGTSDEVLARQFRLHLHRGIGYLAAPNVVRSLADLVGQAAFTPLSPASGERGRG